MSHCYRVKHDGTDVCIREDGGARGVRTRASARTAKQSGRTTCHLNIYVPRERCMRPPRRRPPPTSFRATEWE